MRWVSIPVTPLCRQGNEGAVGQTNLLKGIEVINGSTAANPGLSHSKTHAFSQDPKLSVKWELMIRKRNLGFTTGTRYVTWQNRMQFFLILRSFLCSSSPVPRMLISVGLQIDESKGGKKDRTGEGRKDPLVGMKRNVL